MKKVLSLVLSLALAASCAMAVNAAPADEEVAEISAETEVISEETTEETPADEATEETPAEEAVEEAHYDETLILISNIVSYEYDEANDEYIANCTLPVEITAQKALKNLTVAKVVEEEPATEETPATEEATEETPVDETTEDVVADETTEEPAADETTDETTKEPAADETTDETTKEPAADEVAEEELEVITPEQAATDEEAFTPAEEGDVVTIEEAGYYAVFVEDEEGNFTAIAICAAEEFAEEVTEEEPVEETPVIEEEDDTPIDAKYTSSKVMVNGAEVSFEAYNIKDNNYFKLRDIAAAINGTEKNFEVSWDEENARVNLISATAYTAAGGELEAGDGTDKIAGKGTSDISIDGEAVTMKAYLINDNNYFKLRDLGKLFDFGVEWDGENNCVMINTDAQYTE